VTCAATNSSAISSAQARADVAGARLDIARKSAVPFWGSR
jgi:hypothetical protein